MAIASYIPANIALLAVPPWALQSVQNLLRTRAREYVLKYTVLECMYGVHSVLGVLVRTTRVPILEWVLYRQPTASWPRPLEIRIGVKNSDRRSPLL